jgi:hypothetical protein
MPGLAASISSSPSDEMAAPKGKNSPYFDKACDR